MWAGLRVARAFCIFRMGVMESRAAFAPNAVMVVRGLFGGGGGRVGSLQRSAFYGGEVTRRVSRSLGGGRTGLKAAVGKGIGGGQFAIKRVACSTAAVSPREVEAEDEAGTVMGVEAGAGTKGNGVGDRFMKMEHEQIEDRLLNGEAVRENVETQKKKEPERSDVVEGMGPPITEFRLSKETVRRLGKKGITHMTEVQAGTFDNLYDGHDIIARSRTGTGKTLAFALPILERMGITKKELEEPLPIGHGPGCVVLAPTRELAKQVSREMEHFGRGLGLKADCFYGGVSYTPQENTLRKGLDILVGTPGRIIDHLERGTLDLSRVSFAVLDEADEMLSMGFSDDVETIFSKLPPSGNRQAILFSATVPAWVKSLAAKFQKPDVITFNSIARGTALTSTTVRHCAVLVPEREEARAALLADIIAVYSGTIGGGTSSTHGRTIVFCETKREADDLATSGSLEGCGAAVLHGDVSQRQREVTLSQFRNGQVSVLVATDVAARGLDISGVDVVVQYRIPRETGAYIHRAGRTGRAGRSGTAVIMHSEREQRDLFELERDCGVKFERASAPPPSMALEALASAALTTIENVDPKVIQALLPKAQAVLEAAENPAEQLAGVLALATRRTRMLDRSVLSGESGMKAIHLSAGREISHSFAIRFISELAGRCNVDARVGLIRICEDGSAVLDITSSSAEKLLSEYTLLKTRKVKMTEVKHLPPLRPDPRYTGRSGRRQRRTERFDRYGERSFRGRDDRGSGRYGRRDSYRPRDSNRPRDSFRRRESRRESRGAYGRRNLFDSRNDGYDSRWS